MIFADEGTLDGRCTVGLPAELSYMIKKPIVYVKKNYNSYDITF